MKQFMPMISELKPEAIIVNAIVADRAVFNSLRRKAQQRSEAFYSCDNQQPADSNLLAYLTDWTVGVGCGFHDAQNGLKYGLAALVSDQLLKDLHIVIEALRNSLSLLVSRLLRFIVERTQFSDSDLPDEVVAQLWQSLGIHANMIEPCASVNLRFVNGALYVNYCLCHDPDSMEKVNAVFMLLTNLGTFRTVQYCARRGPRRPNRPRIP
jgi:hypothetical protein